jgi:hypothetical protein
VSHSLDNLNERLAGLDRFHGHRLNFLSARQTTTISATDFPWLCGHAIDAKTGITLVGEEVTTAGTWNPAKSEVLPVRSGQFRIKLPATSAAIVRIA